MNSIHKRRLYFLAVIAIAISIATSFVLYALKQNMNLFLTPTEIAAKHLPEDYHLRLGGMVKPGSLLRDKQGLGVQFVVTDTHQQILVRYHGILPDLFREGKGVVAEGNLNAQGEFIATQVLAKHDEKYMPKTVTKVTHD